MKPYRKNAIMVGVLFILGTGAPLLSILFSGFIPGDPDYLISVSANKTKY